MRVLSHSAEDTELLGFWLGRSAVDGLVVTLSGDLGAGKTLLTKGIARGLDVPGPQYVTSPTFTIHKVYKGRLTLNHMDFYRLGGEGELEDLGIEDVLGFDGVTVIEWPDVFYSMLGSDRIDVRIVITGDESREIDLEWRGAKAEEAGAGFERLLEENGRR